MSEETKSRKTGRRRRTTRRLSKRPIRVPGDDVPRGSAPDLSGDGERLELEGLDVDVEEASASEPPEVDHDVDTFDFGGQASDASDGANEFVEPAAEAPAGETSQEAGSTSSAHDEEATDPRIQAERYEALESLRPHDSTDALPADSIEATPEPAAPASTHLEPEPEEKTHPRVDLAQLRRDALPDDDVTTNPRIDLRALHPGQVERTSTLIVSRPKVIGGTSPNSRPPPSAEQVERPRTSRPPPPSAPPPPPPDVGEDLVLEDLDEAQARSAPTPPPPPHESALPNARRAADESARLAAGEAPPPPGQRKSSEGSLVPSGKRPPPPPSEPRAPPPPPVEQKPKKPRQRQWFERFFSDDYLMTVVQPTRAQVARQVDFLEASLGIERGATVLDVGCGLGHQALELSRRGKLVVGLDLSLPMITRAAEEAQQEGVKINFLHTDIREIEFEGTFDAVVCVGTTFGFFDDDTNRDVLARLYNALRPGGRLLLDVVNRDYVLNSQPNLVWFQGDDCVCMEESDFNYFSSRLIVKRTMMREDGAQSDAEYSIRLYALHEIGKLMQQVGFRVLEVSGHEATRGVFFGSHSQRLLILAERRAGTAQTHERPALSQDS